MFGLFSDVPHRFAYVTEAALSVINPAEVDDCSHIQYQGFYSKVDIYRFYFS